MTTEIEFGRRDVAESIREDHPDALAESDDRRLKTVTLAEDAPEQVVQEARQSAAQDRGDQQSVKEQASLTAEEKRRLDFSKDGSSALKAQWVKGTLRAAGVKDWTAYYDPELTVDEHAGRAEEWKADQRGSERLDAEEDEDVTAARMARQAERGQSQQCNHARDECRYGDPEACEFLGEACGVPEDEVEAIVGADAQADPGGELSGKQLGALDRLWTTYRTGLARAREAAAGINEIRGQVDQDPLAFDELGGATITKEDLEA